MEIERDRQNILYEHPDCDHKLKYVFGSVSEDGGIIANYMMTVGLYDDRLYRIEVWLETIGIKINMWVIETQNGFGFSVVGDHVDGEHLTADDLRELPDEEQVFFWSIVDFVIEKDGRFKCGFQSTVQ
jgi:hypothetical protein